MKLVWSAFALSDRDDIFTHIEADNPIAAITVDERIVAAARRLQDFPESGRPVGLWAHANWWFPVRLMSLTETTVRVLRVLHGAQQWPDALPED